MALIKCPDCGYDVSDEAVACPNCAKPIAAPDTTSPEPEVQTIEKTSKKLKGWLAVCMGTFGISALMLMVGGAVNSEVTMGLSLTLFFVSAVGICVVKGKIWWEHQ
ncbi:hypothetical protein LCGC14_1700290 [marine sediment metagenome]|uniref:Zinc-ribbon domain-containing protein n=1 Tax=marine sediment metagenome TaxID=412755 RepID=A0A0F9JYT1_9ZZZZ